MVALIVLNFNDYETTEKFVNGIKEYQSIGKIVVVDNCSTDQSYEKLSCLNNDKIDVIQTVSNKGYASGNNYGICYALEKYNPEYFVISNPDVEFEQGIIEMFLEYARKVEKMGTITCRMHCTSGIHLPVAWRLPQYKDCLLENLMILKRLLNAGTEYPKSHFCTPISKVDVVPGSFFMISTKAYMDVKGFDEDTFLYYEENMLAAKLVAKGYQNYIINTQEYVHRHSVSINKSIQSVKHRLKMAYDSRQLYCKRYLGAGELKCILLQLTFQIGLFDYLLATRFLKKK